MIKNLTIDMSQQETITVTCNGIEVILSKAYDGLSVYLYGKPNKREEQALIAETYAMWSEAEPYEDDELQDFMDMCEEVEYYKYCDREA